ncbi:hypothetical protein TrRE_jg13273 [Triparma retinervis]|uniref:Uncharacterized protein n=1 Tax=Triparma retinervis TaxID=2557542 RepID=A0A9W7CD59_9STRA|nr:hypothetical protein TrRE_jg13273 [Triparma retinervis]
MGLNVVVVTLPDPTLEPLIAELRETFPDLEFRSVPVSFSPNVDYMAPIKKETSDITIQLIFNNAGFIVTGFFEATDEMKHLVNLECNARAAVRVTHHFLRILVAKKLKGCICFTSSVAGYIPTPFAVMYASTKAFVSQFSSCVAIEVANLGIDVCAVHPSPVNSNFYDKVEHKIQLMEDAKKAAVEPDSITGDIFKSIDSWYLRDLGAMAIGTRLGTSFLPYNFFTGMFAAFAPFLGDYKTHNAKRG